MWGYLDLWFKNAKSNNPINTETILRMYEGREDQINWDKLPPEVSDFPYDVQKAFIAYNKMGDRVNPELGYLGKDFSLYETLKEVEQVKNEEIFLETLLRLDEFYIKKQAESIERASKKKK